MTFELPNLDTKTYRDLWTQIRAAIPQYSTTWTNYNDSDPGVTLLQLLCWVSETQLYRINFLPDALYLNFLRWVAGAAADEVVQRLDDLHAAMLDQDNGLKIDLKNVREAPNVYSIDPDPKYRALLMYLKEIEGHHAPLDPLDIQAQIEYFQQAPYRAVTQADFEALAMETTQHLVIDDTTDPSNPKIPQFKQRLTIRRTIAIVREGVVHVVLILPEEGTTPIEITVETAQQQPQQEQSASDKNPLNNRYVAIWSVHDTHLTLKRQHGEATQVLQAEADKAALYGALTDAVGAYLKQRTLIGTPLRVVPPAFTDLRIEVELIIALLSRARPVIEAVYTRLMTYFDPFIGGADHQGSPYGVPPDVRFLIDRLQDIDGVRFVPVFKVTYLATQPIELSFKLPEAPSDATVHVDERWQARWQAPSQLPMPNAPFQGLARLDALVVTVRSAAQGPEEPEWLINHQPI